jgi:peptide/nickel transport system ATP-binding protein
MTEKTRDPLVTVKDLHVEFDVRDGIVHSVDGASFNIYRGQTLGIIGESGCGKSITAKAILNMVPKPGKMRGEITFYQKSDSDDGQIIDEIRLDQTDPDGETIRKIRGGHIAMIFQPGRPGKGWWQLVPPSPPCRVSGKTGIYHQFLWPESCPVSPHTN